MTVGAAIGWLASIMMRRDTLRQSFANMGVGSVGALATHAFANDKMALQAISAEALLLGAVGAIVLLGLSFIVQRSIVG
ncbi:hypothetical protein ELI_12060 [Erythrobacter litoralis HTCC2594]|uniref:Uncharacterized protein n=2 Tax=Erythrobacter litoralis TaxID=39960 RepID=Q2N737_ERYLH|nr:hypothetical protein ELI_12060 [Erythrobacter litoralis HTCC2594]